MFSKGDRGYPGNPGPPGEKGPVVRMKIFLHFTNSSVLYFFLYITIKGTILKIANY